MDLSNLRNFHVTCDGRGVVTAALDVPGRAYNLFTEHEPWVDGLTIGAALRQTARRFADRDAIVFPQAGIRLTWAEFDREVDRIARGLLAIGLTRGDHFGVWSTNWPQWVLLQFATARVGVVLVTINPAYRAAELEYTLRQSEVRGLALIERHRRSRYFDLLREVCPELDAARPGELRSAKFPHLQWVVRIRGAEHPGMLAWQDLETAGEETTAETLGEAERQLAAGDAINLQYTSGTTGLPKGALLSHRNLLLNAYYAAEHQRLDANDRICIPVPLYHCFGCVLGTMCAAVSGAAMVFPHESFDAAGHAPRRRGRALHGDLRRADHVHRRVGTSQFPPPRYVVAADGNHGRQPLPDRAHETRCRRDGGPRDHHCLRPDGNVAADHDDLHGRSDREAGRHRGAALPGHRGEDRRPALGRGASRRPFGRTLLPRA